MSTDQTGDGTPVVACALLLIDQLADQLTHATYPLSGAAANEIRGGVERLETLASHAAVYRPGLKYRLRAAIEPRFGEAAPLALQNRVERLGTILAGLVSLPDLSRRAGRPLAVLGVGGRTGGEIIAAARQAGLSPAALQITCVAGDAPHAAPEWSGAFEVDTASPLQCRPTQRFDLIWSGGLLDGLDDYIAAFLLQRLWSALAPGGRLVIGNFADTHPTRHWIEWCGDWFLVHRSADDLRRLGQAARIPPACTEVYADQWGAIGFLDATAPG